MGMPSTLKRNFEDDVTLAYPNNGFDVENFLLAMNVHRALLNEMTMPDRGVRRARFLGVLRGQNRPAILIEAGYLSNPREANRIAEPDYRERLAHAVADALIQKTEPADHKPEIKPLASEARVPSLPTNTLAR
jgi:N-acetylmuramoyl-L-alanine amidase